MIDFIGGMIIGGAATLFAMAIFSAGKDDRNDD